jgi:hypothetical protein
MDNGLQFCMVSVSSPLSNEFTAVFRASHCWGSSTRLLRWLSPHKQRYFRYAINEAQKPCTLPMCNARAGLFCRKLAVFILVNTNVKEPSFSSMGSLDFDWRHQAISVPCTTEGLCCTCVWLPGRRYRYPLSPIDNFKIYRIRQSSGSYFEISGRYGNCLLPSKSDRDHEAYLQELSTWV